ncbi:hypothetical protein CCACVL1_05712, partial [Corchorus capsularis]
GSRRRGLSPSMVEHGHGHGHSNVKEEGRDKKVKEDASLTDYDPPHQKPPIHNRKT